MTPSIQPTGKHAIVVADYIAQFYSDCLGKGYLEGSPLAGVLALLRKLGEAPGLIFEFGPFLQQSNQVKTRQFKAFLRCHRLALALRVLESEKCIKQKLRHLKNLDLLDDTRGYDTSWDYLLEIEVAARIQFGPIRPSLGDVDLLFTDGEGNRFGAECKRPRCTDVIPDRVRAACKQLRSRRIGGLVIVGVDFLLVDNIQVGPRQASAVLGRRVIEQALGSQIESTRDTLAAYSDLDLSESIWGVIFCAPFFTHVPVNATEGVANFSFASRLVANPSVPGSLKFLRFLDQHLKIGQMKLNIAQLV